MAGIIQSNGKLNMLSLHTLSEDFILRLLKVVYGWELRNLNQTRPNAEAIDLISEIPNKLIVQVTGSSTKTKVQTTLDSLSISDYSGYKFIFVSITIDSDDLRNKKYNIPTFVSFDPKTDIIDITSIMRHIHNLNIPDQKKIWEFIKEELVNDPDLNKLDSNLAAMVDILCKVDWSAKAEPPNVDPYDITEKLDTNNLDIGKEIVAEYGVYYNHMDKIYDAYDEQAINRSLSIWHVIKGEYLRASQSKSGDELLFSIIDSVKSIITESANFAAISQEELELCVNILVVDAFIRCKIFTRPNKVKNAAS